FVFQRPQHLMTRFAAQRRVFFVEEPVYDGGQPSLDVSEHDGVQVIVARLPRGLSRAESAEVQRAMLDEFLERRALSRPILWFYTPMALPIARSWTTRSAAIVYDCMDELTGFQGAPAELRDAETELFGIADLVFTGGESLYAAKRHLHPHVHAFPSSVDVEHFAQALRMREPGDQQGIRRPRVGFCGVIDERMDLELVRDVARRMRAYQFVMIGPVAKIDPASLPQEPNIHYLGPRPYADLPAYFSGWNVAIMPFAHNAATRFISPTKTPEYLAAGLPVVSTSIADVVRPYGLNGFVKIADRPESFSRAIDACMGSEGRDAVLQSQTWIRARSWDRTFRQMETLLADAIARNGAPLPLGPAARPVHAQPAAAGRA
ncbi:MAG TPA: glycosyltransferase, partial [Vicinamibacterales bacterium]|nr:glycosyltransferase [Vicinamibacterales bacterium]